MKYQDMPWDRLSDLLEMYALHSPDPDNLPEHQRSALAISSEVKRRVTDLESRINRWRRHARALRIIVKQSGVLDLAINNLVKGGGDGGKEVKKEEEAECEKEGCGVCRPNDLG